MTPPISVSVIVCTRNRANSLRRTLESLAKLSVPAGLQWELIIVDNNSSDNTREVVEDFSNGSSTKVRYVFERKQGLSIARNAGIREAKGEILAFTDDDVLPEADWLRVIHKEFLGDRNLGAISGRVDLENLSDVPVSTRLGTERVEIRSLDATNLFIGCNFAVRRALVDQVGHFDPDFGGGARFLAAEDWDFTYRIWKEGAKLVYVPSLLTKHDHGRKTLAEEMEIRRGYVIGRGAFYAKHVLAQDWQALRTVYNELDWSSRAALRRTGKSGWRHPYWLLSGFVRYFLMRISRSIGLSIVGIAYAFFVTGFTISSH